MITEKDEAFLRYWERNRDSESTFVSKITRGLPMALMFTAPVILFVLTVKIFIPDWYMKVSGAMPGAFVTIVIALLVIVIFFSFFRMQYKWEMNEQLYNELKHKSTKSSSSNS